MSARPANIEALERILDHRFARPEIACRALTHASSGGGANNYQRLEFLGDRVLALVVAEELVRRFPGEREGVLTRRLAALVRGESLADLARSVGLGGLLRLLPAEREAGMGDSEAILADAMEAVIAALYLDAGLDRARAFILRHWEARIAAARPPPADAKTALQDWALGRGLPLPVYRMLARVGPAHAPEFTVEVTVEGQAPETAAARSKRRAETAAAAGLLRRLEGRA